MSNALKPCPFCGGEAEYAEVSLMFKQGLIVRCTRCGVKTQARESSFDYCAKDIVSSEWNKRTNDSQAITAVQAAALIKSLCKSYECRTCIFRDEPEKAKECRNYNICLLEDSPVNWDIVTIHSQYEEEKNRAESEGEQ